MQERYRISDDQFQANLAATLLMARSRRALQVPQPVEAPVYNKTRENERRARKEAKEAAALARKGGK